MLQFNHTFVWFCLDFGCLRRCLSVCCVCSLQSPTCRTSIWLTQLRVPRRPWSQNLVNLASPAGQKQRQDLSLLKSKHGFVIKTFCCFVGIKLVFHSSIVAFCFAGKEENRTLIQFLGEFLSMAGSGLGKMPVHMRLVGLNIIYIQDAFEVYMLFKFQFMSDWDVATLTKTLVYYIFAICKLAYSCPETVTMFTLKKSLDNADLLIRVQLFHPFH